MNYSFSSSFVKFVAEIQVPQLAMEVDSLIPKKKMKGPKAN